MVYIVMFFLAR